MPNAFLFYIDTLKWQRIQINVHKIDLNVRNGLQGTFTSSTQTKMSSEYMLQPAKDYFEPNDQSVLQNIKQNIFNLRPLKIILHSCHPLNHN